jgi:hypothetical protein
MAKYSAKQNKLRGNGKSKRRFLQLFTNVERSTAYHALSIGARCTLIELLDKYAGCNNGMISMGVRDLEVRLKCSRRGAGGYLHELDDAGLARPTRVGAWRGKQATQWRLTFYRCDLTGELPVTHWEPRSEGTTGTTKGHHGNRREPPRAPAEPQKPKNPMNGSGPRAPAEPYLHIYQRVGNGAAATLRDRKLAWLHKWTGA